MRRWTSEDTLKSVAVGAALVLFSYFEGSTYIEKLGLGDGGRATAASSGDDDSAHREALALERRFPMIDVVGYGHTSGQQNQATYVVFGVLNIESVRTHEGEITLALMQMAGRLAAETSDILLLVHFSLSEEVITGEVYCPIADYAVYDDMVNAGCEATVYPPDMRYPLPESMALWWGVGR